MSATRIAFATPADAPRWQRWLLFSPLARVAIFVVLGLLLSNGIRFGGDAFFGARAMHAAATGSQWTLPWVIGYLSVFTVPAVIAYLLLVRLIERRPASELSLRRVPRDFGLGALGGLALFSTIIGVLWLAGGFHFTGTDPHAHWVLGLLSAGLGAGIGEEILFRGVLFRISEEGLGTWAAILISALFFGAAHLGNPHATLWSALAIAIEAGVLLALIYHLTRSLWVTIGVHAAWNFAEGSIYGLPDSGTRADGLLVTTRSGPDWLTGGAFGVEASTVAVVICAVVSIVLLVIAWRRHTIIAPALWRHRAHPLRDM